MLADFHVRPTLPAGDIGRAKHFYENTLGFKISEENEAGVTFVSGDAEFFVYPTPTAGTAQNTAAAWEVSDLDAEMADLRAHGVTFEEYDSPELKTVNGIAEREGMRCSWFKDTEGNTLAVVQMPAK